MFHFKERTSEINELIDKIHVRDYVICVNPWATVAGRAGWVVGVNRYSWVEQT